MKRYLHSIGLICLGLALGWGMGGREARRSEPGIGPIAVAQPLANDDGSPVSGGAAHSRGAPAGGWARGGGMGSEALAEIRRLDPQLFEEVQSGFEEVLLAGMIEQLAERDPVAAAAYVANLPPDRRSESILLLAHRWSASDPAAALAWFQSQQGRLSDVHYREGLSAVLSEYAQRDPVRVLNLVNALGDVELRDRMLDDVAVGWAERDAAGAIDWLATLSAENISIGQLTRCYTIVMERFLRQSPQDAARAIGALESEPLQSALAPQVALELAGRDWAGAVEWLGTLRNEPAVRGAVVAMVDAALPDDPGRAFDLIKAMSGVLKGDNGFNGEVFFALASADASIVKDRLREIPPAARPAAVASHAEAWLGQGKAPAELVSWIEELPPGPAFDEGATALVGHFSATSTQTALAWVDRVGTAERRFDLFGSLIDRADGQHLPVIASAMISADLPAEKRRSLEARLDTRLRDEFSTLVLP